MPEDALYPCAMELSGHRSDRYIWRYVRPDEQSLAEGIDDLD